jgi:hypothetical protein
MGNGVYLEMLLLCTKKVFFLNAERIGASMYV